MGEDGNGRIINTKTGQPFTYMDTCVRLGPTLGHNPEAHAAAVKTVKDELAAAFGMR